MKRQRWRGALWAAGRSQRELYDRLAVKVSAEPARLKSGEKQAFGQEPRTRPLLDLRRDG